MSVLDIEGAWTLALEDGTHRIYAAIQSGLLSAHLHITWDDRVLHHAPIFLMFGELRRFEQDGHQFVLRYRGYGSFGKFVLLMDDKELTAEMTSGPLHLVTAAAQYVTGHHATTEAAAAAPAPAGPHAASPALQFVKELSCTESDEVIGREEYPMDNRFGSSPFSTDRQVSKETTNELSVDVTAGVKGGVNAQIITAIKAEVEAQFTRQTGHKVGEKVTESQTLHFTVAANQAVLYQVVWKRKVRTGEQLYMASGIPVTIPYRVDYGLSCEVRTLELPKSD
jgi:hypothetical protein